MKKNRELSLKHLKYLFGNYNNNILEKLTYDYISIYSITPQHLADEITRKISKCTKKILKKNIDELVITEMTACIGGNVISFAKKFKHVNAIELCKERYDCLKNNLSILKLDDNVTIINGDSLKEVSKLYQDIIFFDIPWGGKSYKYKETMNLYISKIPSYDACNMVSSYTKIIVMKIPNNFNILKFKNHIKMNIDTVDLDKFKLLILY